MSQGFKFRYDEMKEGNPANREPQKGKTNYPEAGNARNVCFGWLDGRKKFLNYGHLISGEYLPEESSVLLVFTSETVVLKGSNLETLFDDLFIHLPRQISCSNPRYEVLDNDQKWRITEITIQ